MMQNEEDLIVIVTERANSYGPFLLLALIWLDVRVWE